MRVAVCTSDVPFTPGGARNLVDWLAGHLREAGHDVESVALPFADSPELLFRQMAAYRWIDLESADRIICVRPPSHLIPHPNKVVWFIHHLRPFYDLWDSRYRGFPDDLRHRGIRTALHEVDTAALREARRVFANSRVVADRLRRFNGIDSEILYPPLMAPERFRSTGANDEIITVGRIEHHKRQHLLVQALRHTKTPVTLRICGRGTGSLYADELRAVIGHEGVEDRVRFEDRWISEPEKIDLLGASLAAAYVPLDEDSYGYATLEAAHSSKAILTTTDAGGVLEFVTDGVNGLVVEPTPTALGDAMDRLYLAREGTRRMGESALARVAELGIAWGRVTERLLS